MGPRTALRGQVLVPRYAGRTDSAWPRCDSTKSGCEAGSRLMKTVCAPTYRADRTKFDAGLTVPEVPTAMNKSQSRRARFDSHSYRAGMGSSNNTTSGRSGSPHREQAGAFGGAASSTNGDSVQSSEEQRVRRRSPCSAMTRVLPAR